MHALASTHLRIVGTLGFLLFAGTASAQEPAPAPAPTPPPTTTSEPDDTLDRQRERFREGMEKYRAGAFADAIVIWEAIYRDLGAEKGYRLAFNIARAYEQAHDTTRAAEHYEAYLKETRSRHEAGETLEPQVLKQEDEAKERLAELAATKARIKVTSDRKIAVKIDQGVERLADFVAYVTPGKHTVIFNPGAKDEQRVEVSVELGQQREVSAPATKIEPPPLPLPIRYETREERPYSKTVLYVAGGLTLVSVVVPIVLYSNAISIHDEHDAIVLKDETSGPDFAGRANKDAIKSDYSSARSTAYASLAIPIVLGTATLGLAAYWLFGTKETRVPIQGGLMPGAGMLGTGARF